MRQETSKKEVIIWLFVILVISPLLNGCGIFSSARKQEQRQSIFAYEFYRKSEYYRAAIEYRRLVNSYPTSVNIPNYLFQAAESYYLLRKYHLAIPKYENLINQYPDSKFASKSDLRIGQSMFYQGEYRASARHYRQLARKYPTSRWADDALYYAGNINQYQLKDSTRANEYYRQVVFEYPESDSADDALRSLLWYELKVTNKPEAAQELCRQIIKRSPKSKLAALAQYNVAKIYRENLKDKENSLAEFSVFTKVYPESSIMDDVIWEMGLIYEDEKKFNKAIETFNDLIDKYPYSQYRERALARIEHIRRSERRRNRTPPF